MKKLFEEDNYLETIVLREWDNVPKGSQMLIQKSELFFRIVFNFRISSHRIPSSIHPLGPSVNHVALHLVFKYSKPFTRFKES